MEKEYKGTAYNGRFGTMAAVIPQTILWEFQRYYSAASSVKAPPAPSRWDVGCNFERSHRKRLENLNVEFNVKRK